MQNRNSAWCDIEDTPLSLPREGAATGVLGYRGMNLLKVLCLRHIRQRPRPSGWRPIVPTQPAGRPVRVSGSGKRPADLEPVRTWH
jgi:hypothetical protein